MTSSTAGSGSVATYDVFLAHAGADIARARELYRALAPSLRVFFDAENLLPGDEWDRDLPRAQRAARMTVLLVTRAVDRAWYLREEIATAIALQRTNAAEHRTVPVYLDGFPRDPMDVPYGLRVLHGLDATAEGWPDGIARKLVDLAARLPGGVPAPSVTPVATPAAMPFDRVTFFDALCKLLPSQFEAFVLYAGLAREHIAVSPASISMRALDAAQLVEQAGTVGTDRAVNALRRVAPGLAL